MSLLHSRRNIIWLAVIAAILVVCELARPSKRGFLEMLAEHAVPGASAKILREIDERSTGKESSPETVVNDQGLPGGHRRMFAVAFSSEDIENGGFSQYYINGLGCLTVPAVEAYAKAGETKMVAVMKKALKISLNGGPISADDDQHKEFLTEFRDKVAKTKIRMPPGFLDGIDVKGLKLDDLNDEYYELQKKLPGADKFPISEVDGFITWYYEKFPEEFVFSK